MADEKKLVTIRDVAAAAGVSRSTVSLVLNQSPLVKEETRVHVLRIIDELHYVPNNSARSLSSKVMNNLGVVIFTERETTDEYDFRHSLGLYSMNVLDGICDGLSGTDYNISIEHFSQTRSAGKLPKLIANRRVDGVILVGGVTDSRVYERVREAGIPFVSVSVGNRREDGDCVWTDPAEAMPIMTEYLVNTGHKHLAFINCSSRYLSAEDRRRGFFAAAEMYKGRLKMEESDLVAAVSNDGEGGMQAMRSLWENGSKPDCVIAANAPLAVGALRYLSMIGVRVPQDVSVVAYEDNFLCSYMNPPLTAVNIHKEQMGLEAARLILARLQDPDREYESFKTEPCLVLRGSVKERD